MKSMKYKLLIFIANLIIGIISISNVSMVNAVSLSGNNGSGTPGTATGNGQWQAGVYGVRITIVNNKGKQVSGTKTVNIVNQKTYNGKNIYTTKESDSKVEYALDDKNDMTWGNYQKNIIKVSSVPKLSKLRTKLEGNDHSLLRSYVNDYTGYKCLKKPNDESCGENMSGHHIIVEPLTVVGTYGTRYNLATGYELAYGYPTTDLGAMFVTLNNALYDKSKETFNTTDFKPGSACVNNNRGFQDCYQNLKKHNGYGMGVYHIKNFTSKITIVKKWTNSGNQPDAKVDDKWKSTYELQYKKTNGKWKKFKQVTINGNNKTTVYLESGKTYRILETNWKVGDNRYKTTGKVKYTLVKSGKTKTEGSTATSKNFKYVEGKEHKITYTNYYKTVGNGEKVVTVVVYPRELHNSASFKTFDLLSNVGDYSGYYFRRLFGGATRLNSKGYQYDVKIKDGWYGPVSNEVADATNGNGELTKCKAAKITSDGQIGDQIYSDSDSWRCFQFCYNGNGQETCVNGIDPFNKTAHEIDTFGLSSWLTEYSEPATFILEKQTQSNSWTIVETKNYDPNQDREITFDFKYEQGTAYHIREVCEGCGGVNTYSKISRYTTTFVEGGTSKAFTPNKTDDGDNPKIEVYVINNVSSEEQSCKNNLNEIYANRGSLTAEQIKSQLLALYSNEKDQGKNYNKLLNFSVTEGENSIQSKIANHSIDCAEITSTPGSTSLTCEESEIRNTAANPVISSYVNSNNYANSIASSLFDNINDNDPAYCYVNYKVNFKDKKIIKNNTNLFNSSFLWPSIASNQVGTLTAEVECVGNTTENTFTEDNIKKDYLIGAFDNINLKLNDKIVQNLNLLTDDRDISYNTKNSESDQEGSVLVEGFCDEGDEFKEGLCYSKSNGESYCPINYIKGSVSLVDEENSTQEVEVCIYSTETVGNDSEGCPNGYNIDEDTGACYNEETEEELLTESSSCPSNTTYSNYACHTNEDRTVCPSGYELDDISNVCYKSESIDEDISSDSGDLKYHYFQKTIDFPVVYGIRYYANILNGTADTTNVDSSKSNIGWGVPIPIQGAGGDVSFTYKFDSENYIYKLLNSTTTDAFKDDSFTTQCSYTKENVPHDDIKNDYQVRFIDTTAPFSGKSGNNRATGSNWNSCYVSVLNRVGQISDISYCNVHDCSAREESGTKNKYCRYGDWNCDGTIDLIFQFDTNMTDVQKNLADVNQDGIVDKFDVQLINIWNTYNSTDVADNVKNLVNSCISYNSDYHNADPLITNYISNSESSSSNKEPMYSFVLSSADISAIRQYNNDRGYNESSGLNCSGRECISTFITDLINNSNNLKITSYSGTCLDSKYQSNSFDENENITYSRKFCSNTG